MSALGHKRTFGGVQLTSALPLKADIVQRDRDVRFVPKADSRSAAIGVVAIVGNREFSPAVGAD
jgi:hypothetical protein